MENYGLPNISCNYLHTHTYIHTHEELQRAHYPNAFNNEPAP